MSVDNKVSLYVRMLCQSALGEHCETCRELTSFYCNAVTPGSAFATLLSGKKLLSTVRFLRRDRTFFFDIPSVHPTIAIAGTDPSPPFSSLSASMQNAAMHHRLA